MARAHLPTRTADDLQRPHPPIQETWLVDRLASGEAVSISRPDEFPMEALGERVQNMPLTALLGVPASVTGKVVCALLLASPTQCRRWPLAMVERLRLVAEILGAALQRRRSEMALRSSVAEIERLNAQLEADNVYLKEEIKSYHDFDDIVGESAPLRLALSRAGAGGADQLERAAARPDRNRQGAVRPRAARAQPAARAAAGARQLRGAAADAGRKRALRPREGRLHRRRGHAPGPLRAGRRRHDLPGRNRRPAARTSR